MLTDRLDILSYTRCLKSARFVGFLAVVAVESLLYSSRGPPSPSLDTWEMRTMICERNIIITIIKTRPANAAVVLCTIQYLSSHRSLAVGQNMTANP